MNLRNVLFWDTDPSKINYDKQAAYVIERVVRFGTWEEWNQVIKYYGEKKIKTEVLQMRELDEKTLNYLAFRFNIAKKDFRCYSLQQSTTRHYPS